MRVEKSELGPIHRGSNWVRMMKIIEKLHQLLSISKARKPKKGHFVVYVGEQHKRYVIPLKCLSSIVFQQLLDQFQDQIHSAQDGKIILPCSTPFFEWVLHLSFGQTSIP